MYEKSSANNKVYQMKKLFNLKKVEGIPIAQHLNEFNQIVIDKDVVVLSIEEQKCEHIANNDVE